MCTSKLFILLIIIYYYIYFILIHSIRFIFTQYYCILILFYFLFSDTLQFINTFESKLFM